MATNGRRSQRNTRRKPAAAEGPRGRGRPAAAPIGAHDLTERVALSCKYLFMGHSPTEVRRILAQRHNIRISREAPYRHLRYAGRRGWARFVPPLEHTLLDGIRSRHPWLQGVKVVHTPDFGQVADHAAETLVELVAACARPPYPKSEVHVGLAGGHVMKRVTDRLSQLLCQPTAGLPQALAFHALVAGFDPLDPTTGPNTFAAFFEGKPALQVRTRFIGLQGPPLVESAQLRGLLELHGIREAFAQRSELDIVVTSVGTWSPHCDHSLLRGYMARSDGSLRALDEEGYLGDMLWRPLGPDGPITRETGIRALSLLELTDLPVLIAEGKAVLLVVAPCRVCAEPRARVLETILSLRRKLITHLVVDSRTAAAVLANSA